MVLKRVTGMNPRARANEQVRALSVAAARSFAGRRDAAFDRKASIAQPRSGDGAGAARRLESHAACSFPRGAGFIRATSTGTPP